MWCYRNCCWKYSVHDESNYERDLKLEELSAFDYTLIDSIPTLSWKCEFDLIKHLRACSDFFLLISDKAIITALYRLSNDGLIKREWVDTDLEENKSIKKEFPIVRGTDSIPEISKGE